MALDLFHPLIREWFTGRFGDPTEPQRLGWPHIAAGRNTLIAAPTGSGKTLSAFLGCLDSLVREGLDGTLDDVTRVVYVSPLKALSNDIRRNLEVPLAQLTELAQERGLDLPAIRSLVRTGDTPMAERQGMLKRPPHILVTTPESLYLVLTSPKSREILRTVRTVIVDEIHALARDKRGSHLALSLERLDAICERPPVRIGLSATQSPIEDIAGFLTGADRPCQIVDVGHLRDLDLALEVPPTELEAVCSHETWAEIYMRLVELIQTHRSTLVFVNTRRMAERMAHQLGELLGPEAVASHHGSLSREIRLSAEERLKRGELKVIVATASLEMGIDIGYIDLVCQIGSPRAIATFLQRVGRSGHSLGALPKGRLFPLTRDELLECLALVGAVKKGKLDKVEIPQTALDILAQQIVATASCEPCLEQDLYDMFRRAWPYRNLTRKDFDEVIKLLCEGYSPSLRRGAWLHRDAVQGEVRGRRGARLAAITSGGAIPEMADYRVVTDGERTFVGTVNEDFAIESTAGDVFLLGNTSWRIHYVRGLEVTVSDAQGAPASIPFWLGEAPGRTVELSAEVSKIRETIADRADDPTLAADLIRSNGATDSAAQQAIRYVAAEHAALGMVPTCEKIVFERFFDESGGMQLVIHAPLGSRINRAWGLSMRKRFCRSFDFELQAAANDNGVVLSLSPQHSFPITDLFGMLKPGNAEKLLVQALLAFPLFQTRWRWNATRALGVLRNSGGKKVPPPIQRFRAEDLLAAVFPAQVGCLENHHGDVEIPDHPMVRQTMHDCLHEALDIDGLVQVLKGYEQGTVEFFDRDTREPSPFSHELLNANPYAFLDGAPLEERRARAVATRRLSSIESLRDLGRLDAEVIASVTAEAWPVVRDQHELHDALNTMGMLLESEAGDDRTSAGPSNWCGWFEELCHTGRAARVIRKPGTPPIWIAAEGWPQAQAAWPAAQALPVPVLPDSVPKQVDANVAWVTLTRGRIEKAGPITARALAGELELEESQVESALMALEGEGTVLRGRFTPRDVPAVPIAAPSSTEVAGENGAARPAEKPVIEWCDRRLLARIHRQTLDGLRRQIQPSEPEDYLRFLVAYHRLTGEKRHGPEGLSATIEQLQGFELPAGAWEEHVLSARVEDYETGWLDQLTFSGELAWGRLRPPKRDEEDGPSQAGLTRTVPISLVRREDLGWLLPVDRASTEGSMRGNARQVLETLTAKGALFQAELRALTGMLPTHLDEALQELVALGLVSADAFGAVRSVVAPTKSSTSRSRARGRSSGRSAPSGRWSKFPGAVGEPSLEERLDRWAWQLLKRYGVVFRELVTRESVAPSWSQLVSRYRRMELRGEIRGGRFVRGVAGEQFATGEAVEALRKQRDEAANQKWLVLSAADPLNLLGIITRGPRIPATNSNRFILRDGRLVASQQGGRIEYHTELPAELAVEMARALRRGAAPAPVARRVRAE